MKNHTVVQSSSAIRQDHGVQGSPAGERGIALIVVLLLMAVLSGLATGYAMNGNIEVQMGTNEVYYAGARAAAEAGLNRAIVEILANTNTNFLAGTDGVVDAANPASAVNDDNGSLAFLLGGAGPYALDAAGEYTYDIEIFDDADDDLYETALTSAQRTQMGEDASDYTNANQRLILRAIGYGPRDTIVRLARVLETVDSTTITTTTTTTLSNPALLVNGNLTMDGTVNVEGATTATNWAGSVHVNGNLDAGGDVTGDATASGTFDQGNLTVGGQSGGGRPTINVPDIHASDYEYLAQFKLAVVGGAGQVQTRNASGVWTACSTSSCNNLGWSYSGGTWNSSSTPSSAIVYAEGDVDIGTTQGSTVRNVSVIATGDIRVHGNAKLGPNAAANAIQFVTDGDLTINNGSDLDPPSFTDGQILVRGQIDAGGSMEFQGRVIVQDVAGAGSDVTNNHIHGTATFRYAGSLGSISTTTTTTSTGPTTYVNNVSGWMEQ